MPIVSFRSKPAESPPEEYPSAPRVKAQTSNEDIAAAKIAAVARGKKARFEEAEKHYAAQKIQAIQRKHMEPAYSGGTSNKQLLSDALFTKVKILFDKMDIDNNGEITKDEAQLFWGTNFAKVNAQAMFNEVDVDGNTTITFAEWVGFWENVRSSNYDEDDLIGEIEEIIQGGSWVDFDDNRTT